MPTRNQACAGADAARQETRLLLIWLKPPVPRAGTDSWMQPEPTAGTPRRPRAPAWTLFFLAPAVGELLSGSSPPAEFFNPFTLLLLAALYGGGALLVREWTLAWHKGWPSLLVLGVAYAIVEEGLCCKSFFDPHWPDVGILGTYGRWLGVNWVWTVHLTGYHTVISILVPITLVELAFPDQRDTSWVGPRMCRLLALGLTAVVVLGLLAFPDTRQPFRPPPVGYVLAMLSVGLLGWLAARLRAPAPETQVLLPRHLFRLGLTAFLGTLGWFLVFWVLPHTSLPPWATVGLGVICAGAAAGVIARQVGGRLAGLAPLQRWALCTGALGFLILLAPIQEATNAQRPDNTTGMTAVGLAFLLGLLWLGRRLRRASPPPALVAPPSRA